MKPKFEILTEEKFKNKINAIEYIGELCDNQLYIEKVIYIEGNYEVNGNFTNENITELEEEADFLFIGGNLVVNGNFNPDEETFPNILIMGNLVAKNIQNGEELIVINGDVKVENMIYGSYNHGGIKINGKTSTKYLINYDHWMIIPNLKAELVICTFEDEDEIDADFDKLKYDIFKTDLLEKVKIEYIDQEEVDIEKMVLDIKNQKNVFK